MFCQDTKKTAICRWELQKHSDTNKYTDFNANPSRFWPHCVNIVCTTAIARSTDRANRLDQWGCKWLTALCSLHQLYTRTRRERRTELTRLLPGSPSAQKPGGTFGAGGNLSQPAICQKNRTKITSQTNLFDNFFQLWKI